MNQRSQRAVDTSTSSFRQSTSQKPAATAYSGSTSSLSQILTDAAHHVRKRFGFDFVGVSLVPSDALNVLDWSLASGSTNDNFEMIRLPAGVGALGKAYALKRCLIVDSVADDIPENERFQYPIVVAEALQSFIAFPLMDKQNIVTIFICAFRSVRSFDDAFTWEVERFVAHELQLELSLIPPLRVRGRQKGFAYSELSQRIIQAQEDERRRIARELHDGISQEVLLAQMSLRKLKYVTGDEWRAEVRHASEQLRDVISHIGAMAKALRPPSLDELGLAAAMRDLCSTCSSAFGVTIDAQIDDVLPLGEEREIVVYRIFQEALSNACKYSGSEHITVLLRQTSQYVHLRVEDAGCGFDTDNIRAFGTGLGIEGMRERALLVGGKFTITSTHGAGTTVTLCLSAAPSCVISAASADEEAPGLPVTSADDEIPASTVASADSTAPASSAASADHEAPASSACQELSAVSADAHASSTECTKEE